MKKLNREDRVLLKRDGISRADLWQWDKKCTEPDNVRYVNRRTGEIRDVRR